MGARGGGGGGAALVDASLPVALHVIPVLDDAVADRVVDGVLARARLRLVANVEVEVLHPFPVLARLKEGGAAGVVMALVRSAAGKASIAGCGAASRQAASGIYETHLILILGPDDRRDDERGLDIPSITHLRVSGAIIEHHGRDRHGPGSAWEGGGRRAGGDGTRERASCRGARARAGAVARTAGETRLSGLLCVRRRWR